MQVSKKKKTTGFDQRLAQEKLIESVHERDATVKPTSTIKRFPAALGVTCIQVHTLKFRLVFCSKNIR